MLLVGVLTFGCNSDPAAPKSDPTTSDAAFPAYPPGPYGCTVGSTLQDFVFKGLLNPRAVNYEASDSTVTEIAMHDFYNPTKDSNKPRALLVTESALWCNVCQTQASVANGHYAYWHPKGVEFLDLVFEDANHNPAQNKDLKVWTETFGLALPTALDPNFLLSCFFDKTAGPFNMIVDLATMKITHIPTGALDCGPDNMEFAAVLGSTP